MMEDIGGLAVKTTVAVLEVLSPLILALVGFAVFKVKAWIATKTNNELVKSGTWKILDFSEVVFRSLQQTTVLKLKALSADGKLTKEDAKAVLSEGVDALKKMLSLKEILAMGDDKVTALATHALEAQVYESKEFPPKSPLAG